MLKPSEAAAYCGLSLQPFERVCPVNPISLALEGCSDKRLLRYDVQRLDAWLDRLSRRDADPTHDAEYWLDKLR